MRKREGEKIKQETQQRRAICAKARFSIKVAILAAQATIQTRTLYKIASVCGIFSLSYGKVPPQGRCPLVRYEYTKQQPHQAQ